MYSFVSAMAWYRGRASAKTCCQDNTIYKVVLAPTFLLKCRYRNGIFSEVVSAPWHVVRCYFTVMADCRSRVVRRHAA